jgi:hypothetical protein
MVLAKDIVKQAQAWIGKKESDNSFKVIIDTYNAHKPLARGYAVKYTDEWCATFVSAVSIKCGATKIIPTECSCGKMIELLKKLGSWQEKDSYSCKPGDIIFYDWEDTGAGDNVGTPNHVGIVEAVNNGVIKVIEGNKSSAVARREIKINGKYIRGFGVPKYDTAPAAVKLDNIPDAYAKEAVEWAVKNGIMTGGTNGDLMLHKNITRQDALVFLYRALNKI